MPDRDQEYYQWRLLPEVEKANRLFQNILDIKHMLIELKDAQERAETLLHDHNRQLRDVCLHCNAHSEAIKWHGRALTALWGILALSVTGLLLYIIQLVM